MPIDYTFSAVGESPELDVTGPFTLTITGEFEGAIGVKVQAYSIEPAACWSWVDTDDDRALTVLAAGTKNLGPRWGAPKVIDFPGIASGFGGLGFARIKVVCPELRSGAPRVQVS